MTTPNMALDLPIVSTTLGPQWASDLNAALELIDSHDHSSGKGVKVTPAGLDINTSLDIQSQNLTDANSYGLVNRIAADTGALGSIQRIGGDLYWITPAGAAVQLTTGSAVVNTGGLLTPFIPASYPYTFLATDTTKIALVDVSGGAVTLNLPAASGGQYYYYIKDAEGQAQTNNITITPNGTDEIDNVNGNYLIDWNLGVVGLISDGVNKWYVF